MKYGNKKTEYNHIIYDSKKEAKRAFELDMLERAGEISGVQRQVTYKLGRLYISHTQPQNIEVKNEK